MESAALRLKKDQDRRLLAGHSWVYSNEIDTEQTPLKSLNPGDLVAIISKRGKWLGWAYANPNSLICARVVSHDRQRPPGPELFRARLAGALSLRERVRRQPYYRVLFGESDGLPGLVLDRYGDVAVAQITTAGMDRQRDDLIDAIRQTLAPKTLVLRNDNAVRELEGLPQQVETVIGKPPGEVEMREGETRFLVDPVAGQKTGWFYDQTDNRQRLERYINGGRVLDLCSYSGGWAINALSAGADHATCVDASANALDLARRNAELNDKSARLATLEGDVFQVLKELKSAGETFDLVIADPPAFIKRRKDQQSGTTAYRRLNEAALAVTRNDGLLVSCSCSFHMERSVFLRTLQGATRQSGKTLQVLEQGQQSFDHPVHPAITETDYLKAVFLRVLSD